MPHQTADKLFIKQVEDAIAEEDEEEKEGKEGGGDSDSFPQPTEWPHDRRGWRLIFAYVS